MIPSEGDALALHRKYGSSERIVRHCQTVARVAKVLADEFGRKGVAVDAKAVVAAALLHDLGRSRVQTVNHGMEGATMIEREGVDAKVVEIVRKHVGAGIAPEEAKLLGLPDLDYIPRTLEERIVCFADKMVDSDTVRPFEGEVQRFTVKKHDVTRLLALERRLREELGRDPGKLVLDKVKGSSGKASVESEDASNPVKAGEGGEEFLSGSSGSSSARSGTRQAGMGCRRSTSVRPTRPRDATCAGSLTGG